METPESPSVERSDKWSGEETPTWCIPWHRGINKGMFLGRPPVLQCIFSGQPLGEL